jgi:hypothetical protein
LRIRRCPARIRSRGRKRFSRAEAAEKRDEISRFQAIGQKRAELFRFSSSESDENLILHIGKTIFFKEFSLIIQQSVILDRLAHLLHQGQWRSAGCESSAALRKGSPPP